jgi:hypothetical protein
MLSRQASLNPPLNQPMAGFRVPRLAAAGLARDYLRGSFLFNARRAPSTLLARADEVIE